MHEEHGTTNIFSVNHPIANRVKNIRNNWCTEKCQKLKYFDPERKVLATASWSDLLTIYKNESACIVKETPLTFPSLYPTNFDKQKVSLVLNVFSEKTEAVLRKNGFNETARFIQFVLRMWNCLKSKYMVSFE